jgi:hypothetical protein
MIPIELITPTELGIVDRYIIHFIQFFYQNQLFTGILLAILTFVVKRTKTKIDDRALQKLAKLFGRDLPKENDDGKDSILQGLQIPTAGDRQSSNPDSP